MMPDISTTSMNHHHSHQHQLPPLPPQSTSTTTTGLENTTVQIKIQCINHTNPVNVNSPGNLNNVVNMSCPNNHHSSQTAGCASSTTKNECTTNNATSRDSAECEFFLSKGIIFWKQIVNGFIFYFLFSYPICVWSASTIKDCRETVF